MLIVEYIMTRMSINEILPLSIRQITRAIHTEYRVAYSPISTPVESNNKKYLLAKESCQTRIDLRGGSLFAEFVGHRRRLFYGNNFLKILSFHTSVEYIKHSIAYLQC